MGDITKSWLRKRSRLQFLKVFVCLGEGYHSTGSLQRRSSGSDSLPLCFGHFPTSNMKINCMKNSLKFLNFTNTFLWVISRTSKSRDSKYGSAIWKKVMFCIESVNITYKQGTSGLKRMYLQFLDIMGKTRYCIEFFLKRSYGIEVLPGLCQNVK